MFIVVVRDIFPIGNAPSKQRLDNKGACFDTEIDTLLLDIAWHLPDMLSHHGDKVSLSVGETSYCPTTIFTVDFIHGRYSVKHLHDELSEHHKRHINMLCDNVNNIILKGV